MLLMEDFTKLSVGVRVPTDGVVGVCPRCGRNGVRKPRPDGWVRYVHVQTSQLFGDGLRMEPVDSCAFLEGEGDGGGVGSPSVSAPR